MLEANEQAPQGADAGDGPSGRDHRAKIYAWRCNWRRPSAERTLGTWLLAIPSLLIMSQYTGVYGHLGQLSRYAMSFVVGLIGWSLVPALKTLKPRFAVGFCVLLAAVGFYQEVDCARHDAYQPIQYVQWLLDNPATRQPYRLRHIGCILDEWAGPTDVIAVDEAPDDSWIYPAYGRHFTRHVILLPSDGPVVIPADVRWVLIDRHYSVDRGDHVQDAHELLEAYKPGPPRAGDLRVLDAMQQDPDFMMAAANSNAREYLFMRKPR